MGSEGRAIAWRLPRFCVITGVGRTRSDKVLYLLACNY
jgi:hypothetical protein